MYVEQIAPQIQVNMHINMRLRVKVVDIIQSMVPVWLQQPYIMMQSTEHAGYRTVKPMMKKLLMDMLAFAEKNTFPSRSLAANL